MCGHRKGTPRPEWCGRGLRQKNQTYDSSARVLTRGSGVTFQQAGTWGAGSVVVTCPHGGCRVPPVPGCSEGAPRGGGRAAQGRPRTWACLPIHLKARKRTKGEVDGGLQGGGTRPRFNAVSYLRPEGETMQQGNSATGPRGHFLQWARRKFCMC